MGTGPTARARTYAYDSNHNQTEKVAEVSAGNFVTTRDTYDDNNNLLETSETDVSTTGGVANESFMNELSSTAYME